MRASKNYRYLQTANVRSSWLPLGEAVAATTDEGLAESYDDLRGS